MNLFKMNNTPPESGRRLLKLTSSANPKSSTSAMLADEFIGALVQQAPDLTLIERDLNNGIPHLDTGWIEANNTAQDDRNKHQQDALTLSDHLVAELQHSDFIVMSVAVYNFSIPSTLKAWIDHVCRARLTFRYGENGPEGLLKGKKALVIFATGGTEIGGGYEFASAYLRHVLGFIGITDVTFAAADRLSADRDTGLSKARSDMKRVLGEWVKYSVVDV